MLVVCSVVPEEKSRDYSSGEEDEDFVVEGGSEHRSRNRLSESKNDRRRSSGQRRRGGDDLRLSGHRRRFRNGGDIRYRVGAAKIYRRSYRSRFGIDDQFSLPPHRTVAAAFIERTGKGDWKIDHCGDAFRRGARLSRSCSRNHRANKGREIFAKSEFMSSPPAVMRGLLAAKLPEVDAVHPNLTLEGLRIVASLNGPAGKRARRGSCSGPDT